MKRGILRRLHDKVYHKFPGVAQRIVRSALARRPTRDWMNSLYRSSSPQDKERYYWYYAKVFRESDRAIAPGDWLVDFAGKPIALPLRGDLAWLDWDLAVSACGHDPEIKATYEALIHARRPGLFLDIGANYGQHSLLFLAHGIPTVTFEPNPACHDYFLRACELNGLTSDLQPMALDEEEGWADLRFPERETWLGTIDATVGERIAQGKEVASLRVRKTTLDDFVSRGGHRPQLIKIDTEGNEARVLRGGRETLRNYRPIIIFETWKDSSRDELLEVLEGAGYQIAVPPLIRNAAPVILERDVFRTRDDTNYLAVPAEQLEGGRDFWRGG